MKHTTSSLPTALRRPGLLLFSLLGFVAVTLTGSISNLQAQSRTISFESDSVGIYSSTFRSASDPTVAFWNNTPILPDWQIGAFGVNSRGNRSLLTLGPASNVEMTFSSDITSLSFYYGGDAGSLRGSGVTRVTLKLYNNGIEIREITQVPNFNNRMDQRIGISGPSFDAAVFAFTGDNGIRTTVGDEVIDDIVINGGGGGGGGGGGFGEQSDGTTRDPTLTRKQKAKLDLRNAERQLRKAKRSRRSKKSTVNRLKRRIKRLKKLLKRL